MTIKLILTSVIVNFAINCVEGVDDVTNGTELIFVFLVHRHGDRTPIDRDLSYSKDPEALARVLDKYGVSQLTPSGQFRGYQIGKFIRKRYSSLLSSRYNQSEIYIRSTDVTRTEMTVLAAMAAVYPPDEDNWSKDINWTPIPYSTEDNTNDFLSPFMGSCPKYMMYLSTYNPPLPQYQDVLNKWSQTVGRNLTNDIFGAYTLYMDYESLHSEGLLLIDALEEIWPEIEEVAQAILEAIVANEDTLPLLTGVLLSEFFKSASAVIVGGTRNSPRVRIYSGHDLNVYGLIAGCQVRREERPGVPRFGSALSLEVRKVVETGQYVVLLVYLADPNDGEVVYLPIQDCDLLCNIYQFRLITSRFTLKESQWKKACKFIGNIIE